MAHETGKDGSMVLHIGKRHHRGRRSEEHRKLVDEVSESRSAGLPPEIKARREAALIDAQFLAKIGDLFAFSFQILVRLVCENEIEDGDALLDEMDFMSAPIAKMFSSDPAIEPPRKQVTDDSALGKTLGPRVPKPLDLAKKVCRALAPMGPGTG